MKKKVLGILSAGVLALSLAGCGGDDSAASTSAAVTAASQAEESEASDTMEEAAYLEAVHALPGASTDFSNAMREVMSAMSTAASQEDFEALKTQLEELRSYSQPFYDFAAIDNPPLKYAEAHATLANSCTQMGDVLNSYIDFMQGALEGTASQEDGQAIADQLMQVTEELVQAGKALDAVAAE